MKPDSQTNSFVYIPSSDIESTQQTLTGTSTGTSDGNTASLPYIKKKGVCFVVVCNFDLSENSVGSRYTSQLFCWSFTNLRRALNADIEICKHSN